MDSCRAGIKIGIESTSGQCYVVATVHESLCMTQLAVDTDGKLVLQDEIQRQEY